jgi:hypothetical protein
MHKLFVSILTNIRSFTTKKIENGKQFIGKYFKIKKLSLILSKLQQ